MFITFEGIDGSGKSLHSGEAIAHLESQYNGRLVQTYEPGGTPLAQSLRDIFKDPRWAGMSPLTEIALLTAARSDHVERLVRPMLAQGKIVVSDRYTDSTRAYQGYGRGLPLHIIDSMHADLIGIEPDLTILTTAPIETCMARSQQRNGQAADRLDSENLAFFTRVHDGYLALAQQYPQRFRVFDTSGDPHLVQERIRSAIDGFLRERPQPTAKRVIETRQP